MTKLSPKMRRDAEAAFLERQKREAAEKAEKAEAISRLIDEAAQGGIELSWSEAATAFAAERAEVAARQAAQRQRTARQYAQRVVPKPVRTPSPPGRKPGTHTITKEAIVETYCRLRDRWKRNPTQEELAKNLEPTVVRSTLRIMLTDYNLPWPIVCE